MYLIVLASGRGSRLGNLTKHKPKCFLKLNNKHIIDYLTPAFKYFEKIFIVVGYKKNKFNTKNFKNTKIILNKNFKNTNMVESLFCFHKKINKDCIVVYSDILFDHSILINLIKKKGSIMPVYINWLRLWKKRMAFKNIKFDAENITINKNYISDIGGPIKKKFPSTQYMGIVKLKKFDFGNLKKFYVNLKNNKIDMTRFLNLALKKKIVRIKAYKTKKFWFEIDTVKDFKLANNFFTNN